MGRNSRRAIQDDDSVIARASPLKKKGVQKKPAAQDVSSDEGGTDHDQDDHHEAGQASGVKEEMEVKQETPQTPSVAGPSVVVAGFGQASMFETPAGLTTLPGVAAGSSDVSGNAAQQLLVQQGALADLATGLASLGEQNVTEMRLRRRHRVRWQTVEVSGWSTRKCPTTR